MQKNLIILLLSIFLIFGCSKKNKESIGFDPEDEKKLATETYQEAVEALQRGDSRYASKKFIEAENLLPSTNWGAKSALMSAFALYSANFYSESIFNLQRFIKQYPADKNIPYAHYLIGICYYEQILDEKKDLGPLLQAKEKFDFILKKYPDTDYAIDVKFKIDLIEDQLAAKEIYIARYYIKIEKWIPAINRLKIIVEKYDTTIFVEEALHRLVEIYYKIGLIEEAKKYAAVLGYNYKSGEWYEKSYVIFNKKYKSAMKDKDTKHGGLIRKKIKQLFE